MFLLRSVTAKDLPDLLRLARELNTVNLPSHRGDIRKMIARSERSFAGKYRDRLEKAQFLFVLEDTERGLVVGTSKIFARHGTPRKPHLFFRVTEEDVVSRTLKKRFRRKVYRLGSDRRGFTEIGGLVLAPAYRRHPAHLGKQLSLIRFLYMAAHPGYFRRRVIAELLPPLPGGRSRLWDFYGYKLTRIPYHQADRLSYRNKEFILKLFPKADLYHDILPPAVQADMGQTGAGSTVAKRLLTRIGFQDAGQVDPFDGGPYLIAERSEIKVCRQTRSGRASSGGRQVRAPWHLVMAEDKRGMRAAVVTARPRAGQVKLATSSFEALGLLEGQSVYTYNWR